jgi:hypothetical protein
MRHIIILLVLTLYAGHASAQDRRIAGRIVDARTKAPIPFAALELRAQASGTLANERGYFQLDGVSDNASDSVTVTALGYNRAVVALNAKQGTAEQVQVRLKKKLNPDIVPLEWNVPTKKAAIGSRAEAPAAGLIQGEPGVQYAFLCKSEKGKKLGIIRSVAFYICKQGQPWEPFRVRLYAVDAKSNAPGPDLLNESVVVAAPDGGHWFTVDLTAYNILAPETGFFVAMEWIGEARKCGGDTSVPNYVPCGQVLRPTYEFSESRTWSYTLGKGWKLLRITTDAGHYNAMMRAQVEVD